MTLFDLVFILLFLGSVISLVVCAFLWRGGKGGKILFALASVWGVYLGIIAVTDVFIAQKAFKLGQDQCFDEMCFAVVDAQTSKKQSSGGGSTVPATTYVVKIRVTSHSRGRTQAEGGLRARLYDGNSYISVSQTAQKAYDAQHGESPKLTQRIAPGESVLSVLVFEAPQTMMQPALTLDHGFTPGYFVIGESPFFHKPDIHELSGTK